MSEDAVPTRPPLVDLVGALLTTILTAPAIVARAYERAHRFHFREKPPHRRSRPWTRHWRADEAA